MDETNGGTPMDQEGLLPTEGEVLSNMVEGAHTISVGDTERVYKMKSQNQVGPSCLSEKG